MAGSFVQDDFVQDGFGQLTKQHVDASADQDLNGTAAIARDRAIGFAGAQDIDALVNLSRERMTSVEAGNGLAATTIVTRLRMAIAVASQGLSAAAVIRVIRSAIDALVALKQYTAAIYGRTYAAVAAKRFYMAAVDIRNYVAVAEKKNEVEMIRINEKTPDEHVVVSWDFAKLNAGTVSSVVEVSAVDHKTGLQDDEFFTGSAVTTGKVVSKKAVGGIDYHSYVLRCLCDMSDGGRYEIQALMPVRSKQ